MSFHSHPFHEMVIRMLKRYGDLYSLNDILEQIADGRMQSFCRGETWAVTQINEYPRRKALDLVFVVGDMEELERMESDIIAFGRKMGCTLIMTNGRMGWLKKKFKGWKAVSCMFVKEI